MADEETNKGPLILAVCVPFISVGLLFVAARVWVRATEAKRFWTDDYIIVVAAMVMFAQMILIILQVQMGAGRHVDDIAPEDNIEGLHLNFVTQPLCLIALALVKISIGMLLLRLTVSAKFKKFIWATIAFTGLAFIANFLVVMLQCQPLALVWDRNVQGQCMRASSLKFAAFFNSGVSIVTDLVFAVLPTIFIWKVQMARKTKLCVIPVLSLGFFATIAGIVKMLFLDDYGKAGDFLYDSSEITIWTTVEICLAMIAACAHTLRSLFKIAFVRDTDAASRRTGQYGGITRNTFRTVRSDPKGTELDSKGSGRCKIYPGGSQESIIPRDEGHNAITKTTVLDVFVADGDRVGRIDKETRGPYNAF